MRMKYGILPSSAYDNYCKSLINRIWVLIPLKEEKCKTLRVKIERLNRELLGMCNTMPENDYYIITVIHLLENLIKENDFDAYRSDVLKCCKIIEQISNITKDGD